MGSLNPASLMDAALQATHAKLLKVRARTDLNPRRSPLLADFFTALDGTEKPFNLRYYQVQMVIHLMALKRFLIGDDTGLGKCQPFDSLVLTDRGLVPMGEIEDWSEMEPDTFRSMSRPVHVLVDGERLPIKSFYYGGVKPTITATTRYGFKNTGSRVHPMRVLREGQHQWVQARDLREGDYLCVERREMAFPEAEPLLFKGSGALADRMTPDLARFLGYYIGEGTLGHRNAVILSQSPEVNPEIHADILRLFLLLEGRDAKQRGSDIRTNNTKFRR